MNLAGKYILITALFFCANNLIAQRKYSSEVTATAMNIWKDSFALDGKPAKWTYDQGVILEGVAAVWKATADPQYFTYIQKSMDFFVTDNGEIKT